MVNQPQLQHLTLLLRHLTFHVAFYKTLRASEGSRASDARQVSHQVRVPHQVGVQQAGAGVPVQTDCTI